MTFVVLTKPKILERMSEHIKDKDRNREEKNRDKEKDMLSDIVVFTMDLQAVKIAQI